MKLLIRILFFIILAALGTGYFFIWKSDPALGHRIIGFAVLALTFVLMPLFLIHRYKGRSIREFRLFQDGSAQKNAENQ
ncbi:hypothetical protein SAMN02927921_01469 [Sinomicrobium oceani]|uniref:Uncharacterized protein n=1 Tax=Sinomicrobium oceani TaxID=1150368 RepID=A0A1K1NUI7_9FLAO|nr:hypothetical protein [Sinomicrobium oceani]SFW39144.1 hypothetical protein SAMN02927921_01469 [Sinomicrobium oceani]